MTDLALDVRMTPDGGLLAYRMTGYPHIPWVIVTVDEHDMYTTYTRATAPSGTRPVHVLGGTTQSTGEA